jgi:hypothetical protein
MACCPESADGAGPCKHLRSGTAGKETAQKDLWDAPHPLVVLFAFREDEGVRPGPQPALLNTGQRLGRRCSRQATSVKSCALPPSSLELLLTPNIHCSRSEVLGYTVRQCMHGVWMEKPCHEIMTTRVHLLRCRARCGQPHRQRCCQQWAPLPPQVCRWQQGLSSQAAAGAQLGRPALQLGQHSRRAAQQPPAVPIHSQASTRALGPPAQRQHAQWTSRNSLPCCYQAKLNVFALQVTDWAPATHAVQSGTAARRSSCSLHTGRTCLQGAYVRMCCTQHLGRTCSGLQRRLIKGCARACAAHAAPGAGPLGMEAVARPLRCVHNGASWQLLASPLLLQHSSQQRCRALSARRWCLKRPQVPACTLISNNK